MTAVGANTAPANNNEPINQFVRNTIISSNRKRIENPATNDYGPSHPVRISHSAHVPNHASSLDSSTDSPSAREAR
jgi:hypothetical protein